jgi:hypothetical protein
MTMDELHEAQIKEMHQRFDAEEEASGAVVKTLDFAARVSLTVRAYLERPMNPSAPSLNVLSLSELIPRTLRLPWISTTTILSPILSDTTLATIRRRISIRSELRLLNFQNVRFFDA